MLFAVTPPRPQPQLASGPIPVKLVRDDDGRWTLLRGGEPYFIRGAGGTEFHDKLPLFGGNSLRTWGVRQLEPRDEQGRNLLDRAHELGLTVTVGIWVQQVRHGFDFDDVAAVHRQREMVRAAVRTYRDHPAVLAWGLGNEVEIAVPADNPAIWRELNELAKIVKEEDPHHPVMTVIAGMGEAKIRGIIEHYPEIDILGVNAYSSAPRALEVLTRLGWDRPYVLTEFGPVGPWEVAKTEWGASIEPTSEQKAAMYRRAWEGNSSAASGNWLGGYAFNWGNKQEGTSTWFGMFLPTGERTAAVDVMKWLWTGHWPADRCPEITDWSVPFAESTVAPGSQHEVSVEVHEPEGQPVTVTWWVMAEAVRPGIGGDREAVPEKFPAAVSPLSPTRALVTVPPHPGAYRLFVKAVDPANGASVRNTPFRVAAP